MELEEMNSTTEVPPPARTTGCDYFLGDSGSIELYVLWSVAAVCLVILVIAQERNRFYPDRCYGRPGFPIPMDFLVSPRNRLTYAILFALMGSALVQGYQSFSFTAFESDHVASKIFNKTLWTPFFTVVTLVLTYFPLFSTVEFPHRVVGYIIGAIYSLAWYLALWVPRFVVYDNYIKTCTSSILDRSTVIVSVLRDLPVIILGAYLVLWYFFQVGHWAIWRPLHRKTTFRLHALDEWKRDIRSHHFDRVKALLKKQPLEEDQEPPNIIVKVLKYLFPFKRHYKLPLPFVGAVVAMVMIIYQLSCALVSIMFILLSQLATLYTDVARPLIDLLRNGTDNAFLDVVNDVSGSLLIGVPVVLAFAPFGAIFMNVFLLIHMVASISKKIKSAARCGFEDKLPGKVRRLSGFWKYIGVQIGLYITAWIVYTVIFMIFGLVIIVLFFFLKYSALRMILLNIALTLIIPTVWAKLIFIAQTLICRFVFLSDRKEPDSVKFVGITNRRLYNWFAFVLFFYNGFAGLVAGIIRIVISAVFGIILLFRLDLLSLPQHLWKFDFGHKSYLSFLYLDYCYNNPVVHVFAHLLENSVSHKKNDMEISNVELVSDDQLEKKKPVKSMLVRNRWLVAYTLIQNPSIQQYTANNIELLSEELKSKQERVFQLENTIQSAKVVRGEEEVVGEEKEKLELGDEYAVKLDGKAEEGNLNSDYNLYT